MTSKNFHNCVGEISTFMDRIYWKIPKFNDLPNSYCYRSPPIDFLDSMWRLLFWKSKEWLEVGIELLSVASDRQNIQFGIKGSSLEISKTIEINDLSDKFPLIQRSALKSQENDWMPNGDLLLFFAAGSDFEALPFESLKAANRKEECGMRSNNCSVETSTQTEEQSGMKQLQKNFKELLASGKFNDVILNVDGQEFKSHKCILAARSPTFLEMISDSQEVPDVLTLQNTDADTFCNFLNYLYTGCCMENLTFENVLKLYATAKRFQVSELKKDCLDFMLKNISADHFCDVLNLSLENDEKDLTVGCHDFFADNSVAIISDSKWKTFLCTNPQAVNELLIKTLTINK